MVIDRRALLAGLGSGVILAGRASRLAAAVPRATFAATRRSGDGQYSAAVLDTDGNEVHAIDLPARGHDVAYSPRTRMCVALARRPGDFAVAFPVDRTTPPLLIAALPDRHFYGHGAFSDDGRLFYATENDFEGGRGVIGIYDATAQFTRLGEFASHGLGPHDLCLLRGEHVLVVANGGLREHPDIGGGRRVLNPDAIETSLAYIDARSGDLLEKHELPSAQRLSLRHLACAAGGRVLAVAQAQGPGRRQPLVYSHRRQEPITAVAVPEGATRDLAGYVSSLAVDASGEYAAVTSSRGSRAIVVEIATGRVLETIEEDDVSGVAPGPSAGSFLFTSGKGRLTSHGASAITATSLKTPWHWDNHATALR